MVALERNRFSRGHSIAAFVLATVAAVAAGAQEPPPAEVNGPAFAAREARRARALAELESTTLPEALKAAIRLDISKFDGQEARDRIVDRLRLDLVGRGLWGQGPSARAAAALRGPLGLEQPKSALAPLTERANGELLTGAASISNVGANPADLRSMFTETQVIATAGSVYGKGISLAIEQINPLTPTDDQPAPKPPLLASAGPTHGRSVGPAPGQSAANTQNDTLADCDKPLPPPAELACFKDGMRCETFSRAQFPEVVEVVGPNGIDICSGTLLGEHWVLTAAHCILPGQAAARRNELVGAPAGDARLQAYALKKTAVNAAYSRVSPAARGIDYAIVNAAWDPATIVATGPKITGEDGQKNADWTYPGDLALIRLSDADAIKAIETPFLAKDDYDGLVTTAGYGVTTAHTGAAGDLWIAWPDKAVASAHGQLELSQPMGKNLSTFCKGDSGGPAFEGRHRGCPSTPAAKRPRILIGVTSYYYPTIKDPDASVANEVRACQASPAMRFVNVSAPSHRAWICKNTNNEAAGCA